MSEAALPPAQPTPPSIAARLLALIDLTSLNENDTPESISALAALAVTPAGRVAAFCTWPRLVPAALEALDGSGVPIAAVANFPTGAADASAVAAETTAAIGAGAREIDVVFPYRALLAGDPGRGLALVRACREACGTHVLLKVILETGQLQQPGQIEAAAALAIEGDADFLKTSTGKTQPGATPEAVQVLIGVIAAARRRGRSIGLKISGGVGTLAQAQSYLELYEQTFGAGSASARTLRIGTSGLIKPLLAALE
jgi:deoxyribose-phosphate aldolase